MLRSFILKASLLMVMVALCVGLPTINAEAVPLNWTSPTTSTLISVSMVGASDGWAVGSDGTIIRWNGTDWSNVTSPTTNHLKSVFMVDASEGWAVGAWGTIIHWNGADWSNVTSPTTEWLESGYIVSTGDGWVVGQSGTIIRWTGTEWIPEFTTAILMPLLIGLTLVAIVIAKAAVKKQACTSIVTRSGNPAE